MSLIYTWIYTFYSEFITRRKIVDELLVQEFYLETFFTMDRALKIKLLYIYIDMINWLILVKTKLVKFIVLRIIIRCNSMHLT